MERKSYTEYRRFIPIQPSKLYYFILFSIVVFACVFAVFAIELIKMLTNSDFTSTWVEALLLILIFYLYITYRTIHERVLVHDNGILEIYAKNRHYTIPISTIKQIDYKKRLFICIDVIILILETTQNKKIELMLKENKEFLAELKQHNPNIIIQELPEV